MRRTYAAFAALTSALAVTAAGAQEGSSVAKTVSHYDRAHSGWNDRETRLSPTAVSGGGFGPLWASEQLDSYNDVPPRLFASPLYLPSVRIRSQAHGTRTYASSFLVTTTGYAYAVNTAQAGPVAPGAILWRKQLTNAPCSSGRMGNYSTPVIDPAANVMYVTSCTTVEREDRWSVHALDYRTGEELPGWPVNISEEMVANPDLNKNGTRTWRYMLPGYRWVQRAALNLSKDGSRLYVAFGADAVGWMIAVDTEDRKVASAFSATPNDEQDGGGMWAAGGPAIDDQGRIYMSTGSNLRNGQILGLDGIYLDSENSWAHSILQWEDSPNGGLSLVGTYTPYNYCQAARADIDIGSSAPIVVNLPPEAASTNNLLVLGGGKQGVIYLMDRDNMPGGTRKRPPCTIDPADDLSLLAPEPQPEWRRRGPISLFKPFSDEIGAFDQAKSRTTASYYRDEAGTYWVYVSGSSKKGENFNTSTPPGLAKVQIVTSPGDPAHLKVDKLEMETTFHNPGSPIVSSNGGTGAIVWLVDQNAPRTANLWAENPPQPSLYAFDAGTLDILYQSPAGSLTTTGNYTEVTVANGLVLVGTDRLQAFGLR
jgi:hypothetical protein